MKKLDFLCDKKKITKITENDRIALQVIHIDMIKKCGYDLYWNAEYRKAIGSLS